MEKKRNNNIINAVNLQMLHTNSAKLKQIKDLLEKFDVNSALFDEDYRSEDFVNDVADIIANK